MTENEVDSSVDDDQLQAGNSHTQRPEVELCVLKFGEVYEYTIPSFSVITVPLRHAEVQIVDENGDVQLMKFFFKDNSTLGVPLPSKLKVTDACIVEVSC